MKNFSCQIHFCSRGRKFLSSIFQLFIAKNCEIRLKNRRKSVFWHWILVETRLNEWNNSNVKLDFFSHEIVKHLRYHDFFISFLSQKTLKFVRKVEENSVFRLDSGRKSENKHDNEWNISTVKLWNRSGKKFNPAKPHQYHEFLSVFYRQKF